MSSFLKILIGAAVGGLAGFLYYRFVGCRTGACPLASNPWVSTMWWAVIGGLLVSGFKTGQG